MLELGQNMEVSKMKRGTAIHEATGYIVTRDGHVLTKNTHKYKKTYFTTGGYERVRVGKNKNEYVHRMVIESFTGGKIKNGYEVHHKNKNPRDNRLDNLILLTKEEHRRIHKEGKKR